MGQLLNLSHFPAAAAVSLTQQNETTMPTTKPTMSWEAIRTLTERFTWRDPKSGVQVTGFNPPGGADAKGVDRVPYHIRYVTGKGVCESGTVVTIKVFPRLKQRMVMFVGPDGKGGSRQIRRVRDYLIMEIDGIRIVTH